MSTTERQHAPTAAVYDPDRAADGRFAKGNTTSRGWNAPLARQLTRLRKQWLECVQPEDHAIINSRIKELACQSDDLNVALRACIYWADQTYGRPTERVELAVSGEDQAPVVDLSGEELAVLQRVVRRSELPEAPTVDVEAVIVTDPE